MYILFLFISLYIFLTIGCNYFYASLNPITLATSCKELNKLYLTFFEESFRIKFLYYLLSFSKALPSVVYTIPGKL